jgi:hypothetical protein
MPEVPEVLAANEGDEAVREGDREFMERRAVNQGTAALEVDALGEGRSAESDAVKEGTTVPAVAGAVATEAAEAEGVLETEAALEDGLAAAVLEERLVADLLSAGNLAEPAEEIEPSELGEPVSTSVAATDEQLVEQDFAKLFSRSAEGLVGEAGQGQVAAAELRPQSAALDDYLDSVIGERAPAEQCSSISVQAGSVQLIQPANIEFEPDDGVRLS